MMIIGIAEMVEMDECQESGMVLMGYWQRQGFSSSYWSNKCVFTKDHSSNKPALCHYVLS